MKTVSIVTPTFNSMRTLKEYMAAICGQDYSIDWDERSAMHGDRKL